MLQSINLFLDPKIVYQILTWLPVIIHIRTRSLTMYLGWFQVINSNKYRYTSKMFYLSSVLSINGLKFVEVGDPWNLLYHCSRLYNKIATSNDNEQWHWWNIVVQIQLSICIAVILCHDFSQNEIHLRRGTRFFSYQTDGY